MSFIPMPETLMSTLVARVDLSPRVSLVTLRFEKQVSFVPGQWMSLLFPLLDEHQKPVRRSYSIASKTVSNELEFAVTKVESGLASNFIHDAPIGTQIEAKGPQGHFFHLPNTPSILVATGTGLAPFRPMIHAALERADKNPLYVLFGARSQADELFADEFRELSQKHLHFKVVTSLSKPLASWNGHTGYVQQHVENVFSQLQQQCELPVHIWVCGVRKMLDEVRAVLKTKFKLDRSRIHAESYD